MITEEDSPKKIQTDLTPREIFMRLKEYEALLGIGTPSELLIAMEDLEADPTLQMEESLYSVNDALEWMSQPVGLKADGTFHVDIFGEKKLEDFNKIAEARAMQGATANDPNLEVAYEDYVDELAIEDRYDALKQRLHSTVESENLDSVQVNCPSCGKPLEIGVPLSCPNCQSTCRWVTDNPHDAISSLQKQLYFLGEYVTFLENKKEEGTMIVAEELELEDIIEAMKEKNERLDLEIRAQKKDVGETNLKAESTNCISCGAPLEGPHLCGHCGSHIVYAEMTPMEISLMSNAEREELINNTQKGLLVAASQLKKIEASSELEGGLHNGSIEKFNKYIYWQHIFDTNRALLTNATRIQKLRAEGKEISTENFSMQKTKYTEGKEVDTVNTHMIIARCDSCGYGMDAMSSRQTDKEVVNICSCGMCGTGVDYGSDRIRNKLVELKVATLIDKKIGMERRLEVTWQRIKKYYLGDVKAFIAKKDKGDSNAAHFYSLLRRYSKFITEANDLIDASNKEYGSQYPLLELNQSLLGHEIKKADIDAIEVEPEKSITSRIKNIFSKIKSLGKKN